MKKLIIFIVIFTGIIFINNLTVNAQTTNFYEGEYIDGIWINKYNPSNKTTYYQKARFFRQTGSNKFAYCIEPFAFFNGDSIYESTVTPYNLSQNQLNKISLIAHFGYGYKNHSNNKWYAITQYMIWQISDPNGEFYFTDSLNGNKVNIYTNEINEINNLIKNYNTLPSIANNTYYNEYNKELVLKDNNNVLNNYQIDNENFNIKNNTLKANNLEEGEYTITLTRNDNYYNKPIIFYQSNSSQNLVETGDIKEIATNLIIIIQKTSLNITKIDKDSKSTTSSGDASLDGAVYELYDINMQPITKLEIKDNNAYIEKITYGNYYLKEIKAGEGYELDNNTYNIYINKETPKVEITLENQVIKAKVIINKKYGTENNLRDEKNINFNIYNSNHNLIKTITTNSQGHCEITLPYGKYILEQINSTEGYEKIKPYEFIIDTKETKDILLKDFKIKVPNTYNKNNIFDIIIKFILILCL